MNLRILIAGFLTAAAQLLAAAGPPQAEITNGQIRARLYLPDAKNGFYTGTRFDWSGMIGSLEFQGHNFYGPWFERVDPSVRDFTYSGEAIVASPCTAAVGPAEEFQTGGQALGWQEAKPGGTFIKIGVGVLRKDQGNYDSFKYYQIVDPGRWTVKRSRNSVEFTQTLRDPSSGYAYVYRKTVRLVKGKPEMLLEHSLKNTGTRAIQSDVYDHNFTTLDKQPTGPDFSIQVPFRIETPDPPDKTLAEVRGNNIVYLRPLQIKERVMLTLQGFRDRAEDYDFRIENARTGAGLRITADRPLSRAVVWSIRQVLSVEPFISMTIQPGSTSTWTIRYAYYRR